MWYKKSDKQAKTSDSSSRSFSLGSFPWKRFCMIAGIVLLISFLLFFVYIWRLIASAPGIDSITVSPEESATYIVDQEGTYLRKLTLASSNRDIISLEEIPDSLQKAVVAIEDERFYEHNGIDVKGIFRAFWIGISTGSFSEGASTITQQLIKNNVFTEWTQENSFKDRFSRKIQEQYLALQLEKRSSKEEILEDYLNTINLGAGCYGVQSAARRYFGKDAAMLTLSESAVLAAIPQNPSGYNPITFPEANRKRRHIVLDYMEEQGYISEEEQEQAENDDVYARILTYNENYEDAPVYSYYEDALIEQVISDLTEKKGYSQEQAYRAVYSGGLRIISAQDTNLQQICDEEFQNPANFPEGTQFGIDYALSVADERGEVSHYSTEMLRSYIRRTQNPSFNLLCTSEAEARGYADTFRQHILKETGDDSSILAERLTLSPQPQASLVLLEQSTGYIRALVGGRGEKTASLTLNRATDTTRQPGSTFKILAAYAPALDLGSQTLATTYQNEPYDYKDGTPVSNWDVNDYSGTITIREAITRSINVIAVKCITEITPRTGFDYTRKFGISTLHETYTTSEGTSSDIIQPLALGGITQGVTNLELCAAYGTIANGGSYITPRFYTKILDRHGDIILDASESPEITQVISETTAFLLTSAMEDVVSNPSGTAYGTISASGQPVAGKTGTTSDYRDIWFAGYTPYYTCCVWGGYDNNEELPLYSTCHVYNKLLWSAVMDRVHADLPRAEFQKPDSVVSVTLCKDSHLPAIPQVCPDTYTEYFAQDTQPSEYCSIHEPEPMTEPITILDDILQELETESESETGIPPTELSPELPPDQTDSENAPGQNGTPDSETSPGPGSTPGTDSTGTSPGPGSTPGTDHPGTSSGPGSAPGTDNAGTSPGPGSTPGTDHPGTSSGTGSAPGTTDSLQPSETLPWLPDTKTEKGQPDTSSLEDLMNRLTGT